MNQFRKEHLVVASNASGRNMNVPIYRFIGKSPGPKVYIQSSIHGAEVQGNVVIYHIIQYLKRTPLNGEIILVPNCNPVGTNIKSGEYTLGRFDPVNGQNWNRGYYFDENKVEDFVNNLTGEESVESIKADFRDWIKSSIDQKLQQEWGVGLAEQLNLKLQKLAFDADIVIDLHNGPVATRHIYVPEYAKESAKYFNIPHVILIPNKFAGALDEATFCQWWTLADKFKSKFPKLSFPLTEEAFTVEMGSQEVISFDAGEYDAKGILAYLNKKDCFEHATFKPDNIKRYAVLLKDYKILYTAKGGIVEYIAKPDDHIKKGQLIAKVLNVDELENERAVDCIYAPDDFITILHFPSASVLSGTQLYKGFTHYFEI